MSFVPSDLGAPSKYTSWRPGQERAFNWLLSTRRRFVALDAPTGSGKTVLNLTYATMMSWRSAYYTVRKTLQDQILGDWGRNGAVDVRGMNNYRCLELHDQFLPGQCDVGPCLDGQQCSLRMGGCLYYDQVKRAREATHLVSNYDWGLMQAYKGEGPGRRDILIADEAHAAAERVSSLMRVYLDEGIIWLPKHSSTMTLPDWREWAQREWVRITAEQRRVRPGTTEMRRLREAKDELDRLHHSSGDWVIEETKDGWRFEPLQPGPYAREYLFAGFNKVLLTSATLSEKHLQYLGLGGTWNGQDYSYDFLSIPSAFPIARMPIYHIATVKVRGEGIDPGQLREVVTRMDQATHRRLDKRILVQAVSYDRAKAIKAASEYGEHMIVHDRRPGAFDRALDQYLHTKPPVMLVTPLAEEGLDLAYEATEVVYIPKVPFPSMGSPVVRARTALDRDYPAMVAAGRLEQMRGRAMRAPDDMGETLIFDDQINWLMQVHKTFFSRSWRDSYKHVQLIPPPLPKLDRR